MDTRTDRNTDNIRIRHIKRQQQRKKIMMRRRIMFFTVLGLIVLNIVLFFTPLFNIKNVNISGNERVELQTVEQTIGSIGNDNLFRLNTKKIIANIKIIPYVDDVVIKKKLFPSGINVEVTECVPVGSIQSNDGYIILDKSFKVLERSETPMENVTQISGIAVTAATEGAVISTDDADKLTTVIEIYNELVGEDLISRIVTIDFSDMNNISFNFENRLDVICGSTVDFSKKIGMFQKAITSTKLTGNSRGTIDISTFGKAIYSP